MITSNAQNVIGGQSTAITRPPIVVVLGHVDHGKSSLLEAIKEDFKITSRESGGITQHIGAYEAEYQGRKITFIDTPGHEVFSEMRSRGAKAADIAILVVAADEGVKPQTVEAIQQAKMAGVPIVVAINKADKPEANAERVKQELAQHEIFAESFGGKIPVIETSAVTKQGITDLLEMILLMADMESLLANADKPGEGVVVEASVDSQRGPAATLLLLQGKIKVEDRIATKSAAGKVRILENVQGDLIEEALPSQPVVAFGFESCPKVGETFRVLAEGEAFQLVGAGAEKQRKSPRVLVVEPGMQVLNVIIKADVSGSLEALENVLVALPQDKAVLRLVKGEVGEIGENDVKLAQSTRAHIFGFRTSINREIADLAERDKVRVENFDIIYELVQRVRELMEQSVAAEQGGREDIGSLKILGVFLVDKNRQIIGGKVLEGEAKKGSSAEIVRDEQIVGRGRIVNVQLNKKDVGSVAKGEECGLEYEGSDKIQVGDILKFYLEKTPKKSS